MEILSNYEEYTQKALANFAAQDGANRYSLVDAVDPAIKKVLDVGCGAGQELLPFLEKTDAFCVGVDAAERLGKVTKDISGKTEKLTFVRSNGEKLPFANESFDVVLCIVALPYMNNRETLAEISRILKTDGVFLLKTHAPLFYFGMIRKGIKALSVKQIAYPVICLAAGLWHLLTGKQLQKGFWQGKEIFQTRSFLEKELAKNNLQIKDSLPRNNRRTPSFLIVKAGIIKLFLIAQYWGELAFAHWKFNKMSPEQTDLITKLKWNLPWLVRYPFERAANRLQQNAFEKKHIIFTVANHFEPSWSANGLLGLDAQLRRLDEWRETARKTGEAVRDADGTKFRHTNFYPAEQYYPEILEKMAELQSEGLGETEIHLHHGVEKPDTAENLRKVLLEFRDRLAQEHRLLSRFDGAGDPQYAFVHGNLALANSCSGRFCGVDEEMQILAETGCYADMTLASAPDESQVSMINKIYECGFPLVEKVPHRRGKSLEAGRNHLQLPMIFTGPLVFNWTRRIKGLPVPRIEDGALVHNQPMDLARFNRWKNANITVKGRTDWVFVKLYCHGFFDHDQSACIGEDLREFFGKIIENGEQTGDYKIYFASAREAVNMALAAVDGRKGTPDKFRDYRLKRL